MINFIENLVEAYNFFNKKGKVVDAAVVEDTALVYQYYSTRGDNRKMKIIKKGLRRYIKQRKKELKAA